MQWPEDVDLADVDEKHAAKLLDIQLDAWKYETGRLDQLDGKLGAIIVWSGAAIAAVLAFAKLKESIDIWLALSLLAFIASSIRACHARCTAAAPGLGSAESELRNLAQFGASECYAATALAVSHLRDSLAPVASGRGKGLRTATVFLTIGLALLAFDGLWSAAIAMSN